MHKNIGPNPIDITRDLASIIQCMLDVIPKEEVCLRITLHMRMIEVLRKTDNEMPEPITSDYYWIQTGRDIAKWLNGRNAPNINPSYPSSFDWIKQVTEIFLGQS